MLAVSVGFETLELVDGAITTTKEVSPTLFVAAAEVEGSDSVVTSDVVVAHPEASTKNATTVNGIEMTRRGAPFPQLGIIPRT